MKNDARKTQITAAEDATNNAVEADTDRVVQAADAPRESLNATAAEGRVETTNEGKHPDEQDGVKQEGSNQRGADEMITCFATRNITRLYSYIYQNNNVFNDLLRHKTSRKPPRP